MPRPFSVPIKADMSRLAATIVGGKAAVQLRKVRRAQRRFLRLWAEQRADVWTKHLRADAEESSPLRIAIRRSSAPPQTF